MWKTKGSLLLKGQDSRCLAETALKLNVLRLGPSVNVINDRGILDQYSEVLTGFGKLKNFQLKVPLDETVSPVVQTVLRIPYQLRDEL